MTTVSTEFLPFGTLPFTPHSNRTSHSTNRRNNLAVADVTTSTSTSTSVTVHRDYKDTHLIKVLNRSCKSGNYDEALYFLHHMVNKGYIPDVILCTRLIKGFFNSRKIHEAVKVMEILEKHGEPDVFDYNADRTDSAHQMLDRMKQRGFAPDVITYNMLIGSLCSKGKLELAFNVMDELLEDQCKPTVITFTILIEAIILEGGVDEAMKLLDEMLSSGLMPVMFTYNAIVRGCARKGWWIALSI